MKFNALYISVLSTDLLYKTDSETKLKNLFKYKNLLFFSACFIMLFIQPNAKFEICFLF